MIKGKLKLTITVISLILITCLSAGCFSVSGGSALKDLLNPTGDDALVDQSVKKSFTTISKAVEEKDGDVIYEMLSENVKKSEMPREDIDRIVELLHGTESSCFDANERVIRETFGE